MVALADRPGLNIDRSAVFALAGAGAVLLLGLGLLVARSLTGPLATLTSAAERVAAGDLEQDLPVQR